MAGEKGEPNSGTRNSPAGNSKSPDAPRSLHGPAPRDYVKNMQRSGCHNESRSAEAIPVTCLPDSPGTLHPFNLEHGPRVGPLRLWFRLDHCSPNLCSVWDGHEVSKAPGKAGPAGTSAFCRMCRQMALTSRNCACGSSRLPPLISRISLVAASTSFTISSLLQVMTLSEHDQRGFLFHE